MGFRNANVITKWMGRKCQACQDRSGGFNQVENRSKGWKGTAWRNSEKPGGHWTWRAGVTQILPYKTWLQSKLLSSTLPESHLSCQSILFFPLASIFCLAGFVIVVNYFLPMSFLSTGKMSLSCQLKYASGSGGRFLRKKKKSSWTICRRW